jgi:hypothetical protein
MEVVHKIGALYDQATELQSIQQALAGTVMIYMTNTHESEAVDGTTGDQDMSYEKC